MVVLQATPSNISIGRVVKHFEELSKCCGFLAWQS